jgi:hypothetical protein
VTRKIYFIGVLVSLACFARGETPISNKVKPKTAGSSKSIPSTAQVPKEEESNLKILNFQDDFVRGRSLSPDFLLQLAQSPRSLDSVIYFRKDFNDFHQVDMKSRPKFFAP